MRRWVMEIDWSRRRVRPEHVLEAASVATAALRPLVDRDWSMRAGQLEWTVEATVGHLLGALVKETLYLASRTTRFIAVGTGRFRDSTPSELVESITPAAAALANVARSTPDGSLAYHATGMTDAEGYLAMGCAEALVHTRDACRGLGVAFVGPSDISSAVLSRTHPWIDPAASPWETLLWALGRVPRGDEAPAPDGVPGLRTPLEDWDGTPPAPRPADVIEWVREPDGTWRPVVAPPTGADGSRAP